MYTLDNIFITSTYFPQVILKLSPQEFFLPPPPCLCAVAEYSLPSACFPIVPSGEPLSEYCDLGPLAISGWILWRKKQQPPPFIHYFHQRRRQIRWKIKSLAAETTAKQLGAWNRSAREFLEKFRAQWSSKRKLFSHPMILDCIHTVGISPCCSRASRQV